MISIQLSSLTVILGARAIFRDLNWEIQHDQRIGLAVHACGSFFKLEILRGFFHLLFNLCDHPLHF